MAVGPSQYTTIYSRCHFLSVANEKGVGGRIRQGRTQPRGQHMNRDAKIDAGLFLLSPVRMSVFRYPLVVRIDLYMHRPSRARLRTNDGYAATSAFTVHRCSAQNEDHLGLVGRSCPLRILGKDELNN